jgi:isopentenyl diphosphate isomerase/L-lactate dehydrogenase-like FMN-dependent dehydrogenase
MPRMYLLRYYDNMSVIRLSNTRMNFTDGNIETAQFLTRTNSVVSKIEYHG